MLFYVQEGRKQRVQGLEQQVGWWGSRVQGEGGWGWVGLIGAGGCDGLAPMLAPAREAIVEESAEETVCVGGWSLNWSDKSALQ